MYGVAVAERRGCRGERESVMVGGVVDEGGVWCLMR